MAARRGSKKQWILDAAAELGLTRATPAAIEQIRSTLLARHGPAGRVSTDYVVRVLAGACFPIEQLRGLEAVAGEEFRHQLRFATLEEAERCLARLDELRRRYHQAGDRDAVARLCEVARLGRRRALMIARNPRVAESRRRQKLEIARWFQLWLENPDAFFDWLELRKNSPEFRVQFGPQD